MKTLPLLMMLVLAPLPAAGQAAADHAAVRQALLDYVNGFTDGDSALLVRSVSPQVVKYGYWRARGDTTYAGEPMSYAEIVRRPSRPVPPRPNAPREVEVYEVQDQTASGKVRAWWGTDYILVAREGGRWMIRMVLWQGPLPATPSPR